MGMARCLDGMGCGFFNSNTQSYKNCEDNPPRGNNDKISKIDLAKQDLKTHS
jgi:hypothetical protein